MSTPREALNDAVTFARAQAAFFNQSYLVGLLTHETTGEKYFAWMPYETGVNHICFQPSFLILPDQVCVAYMSPTDQPARC